ncbi:hypothetical protein DBP19_36625 [Streptomyces sp. CS090A]|uniref:hypothetical protein n=1 Tax=Streptomyces sp. CS090A TaxID=2162710 RepID=UPI000D50F9BB|nr:hypothetical protein [Streptomyces sp. CS090A]PVC80379.1 hypothetical protein DBP19_36625 [Streptomyces sp. CS090A]
MDTMDFSSTGITPDQEALVAAAVTWGRAAGWLRTLAAAQGEWPDWCNGPNPLSTLANAIEEALSSLDLEDLNQGGVPPEVREQLEQGAGLSVLPGPRGGNQLTPAEAAAVFAVTAAVQQAADIYAYGVDAVGLMILCRVINHAIDQATAAATP